MYNLYKTGKMEVNDDNIDRSGDTVMAVVMMIKILAVIIAIIILAKNVSHLCVYFGMSSKKSRVF